MKQRRLLFHFKSYTQLWFWIEIQYKFYSVAGHLVSKTQGQPMTVFYLKTRILMWWVSLHLYVLYTSFSIISFINTESQWSQSTKICSRTININNILEICCYQKLLGSFWLGFGTWKAQLGSARWTKSSARLGSPKNRLGYITSKYIIVVQEILSFCPPEK